MTPPTAPAGVRATPTRPEPAAPDLAADLAVALPAALPVDGPAAEDARLAPARAAVARLARPLGLDPARVATVAVPDGADPVPALADALGLRWRPVALAGPRSATALPVVPADGEGWGYELYRRLPDGPLTARALARFAARGTGRDLAVTGLAGAVAGLLAVAVPATAALHLSRLTAVRGGWWWAWALVAAACLPAAVATYVRNAAAARVQARMQAALEPAVWDRLLGCPTAFFREHTTGDLVHRSSAIALARRALSDALLSAVLGVFFAAIGLGVLVAVEPLVALALAGVLAVELSVLAACARARQRHESQVFAEHGRLQGLLYDLLAGLSKLQVSGREDAALERWRGPFARQRAADAAATRVEALATAGAAGLLPAMLACVLGMVAAGQALAPAHLLVVGVAVGQVAMAVGQLAAAATAAFGVAPVLARLRPVLEAPQEAAATSGRDPGRLRGELELRGVTFTYPGAAEPAVAGLDLHVPAGAFVAVVGPSGAGKSTLVRLLLGLDPVEAGEVRYDGAPLADLDVTGVRRRVGTVLQHARLVRGTLRENLTGADPRIDDGQVWAALDAAGLGEDVRALPLGLATRVGEDGQGFSGGQVQRLHLARALVGDPAVLLLDEATSALDNRTQAAVSERVAALRCTRVVIAHRLSTIARADRIVVLDGGRVRAVGRYEELLGTDEVFTALARPQLAPASQPAQEA
ncbi:MAG: ATP-binding cassette domain-containing protein [Kineosporiaceae bacterium]